MNVDPDPQDWSKHTVFVFRHAADAEHEPRAPAPPPHVLRPALHHDSEHRPQEARLAPTTTTEIPVFEIRL